MAPEIFCADLIGKCCNGTDCGCIRFKTHAAAFDQSLKTNLKTTDILIRIIRKSKSNVNGVCVIAKTNVSSIYSCFHTCIKLLKLKVDVFVMFGRRKARYAVFEQGTEARP